MENLTPAQAWQVIKEGNKRFVDGEVIHPNQSSEQRAALAAGQAPHVVLFGCGDSRLAAEIIFDQGLGDMFVVRTAGHVLDEAVMGTIEFGPDVLDVPLIVVLGHSNCGAVGATLKALADNTIPNGYVRAIVEKVAPSILAGRAEGITDYYDFVGRHVKETVHLLVERSRIIADRVEAGTLAVVGLTYHLDDGKVEFINAIGDIGEVGL
ncbi:carbonic anhydrase [Gordonia phthalatica]|uniref:carbonic anhydrase n=1 Tax=Gordonia phthalatica TaxID=1136941 RepID=A0A0N7FV18_9ACTN|nr:carbonic anhydrase [Gordonia phthalatica]ALG85919.1 carbonic anhydrase [Gordonia phthalatica]